MCCVVRIARHLSLLILRCLKQLLRLYVPTWLLLLAQAAFSAQYHYTFHMRGCAASILYAALCVSEKSV